MNVGASGSPAGLSRRPISMPAGFAPARIAEQHQDAARRFWVETMGFSLVTDEPIGEEPGGARWIEVRPPHSAVTLVLYSLTFDASRLGSLSPVLFTCDDIQKTHQELTARGVEFPDPPGRRSWGWSPTPCRTG